MFYGVHSIQLRPCTEDVTITILNYLEGQLVLVGHPDERFSTDIWLANPSFFFHFFNDVLFSRFSQTV